jgi:exonuclease III
VARLLTWNVAGRVGAWQERQLSAIAEQSFELICLQEVTPGNRSSWEAGLSASGFRVAASDLPVAARGSRRLGVLIAARAPVTVLGAPDLPWPERYLAVRTALCGAPVEIHTVHAPLSQKEEQVKVRTLESVFTAVTEQDTMLRILAGDLNTPRYESRSGEIFTFARTRAGNLRPDYGERHDRAELLLVDGLVGKGWSDAFRSLHGYERRDRSWVPRTRPGQRLGPGYRIDHILLSPALRAVACDYVHGWREQGLSDHSGMWADVAPKPTPEAG